jgi:L-lactate dehydrogenase (cytochrome)
VSLEEIAQATPGRKWFQLYPLRSRELMRDLLRRVREAHYEALCVTVDVPVLGVRNRDLRNRIRDRNASFRLWLDGLTHPGWAWPFLRGYRPQFASLAPYRSMLKDRAGPLAVPELNPAFTWSDLEWILQEWNGPTIVKGILHPEDASRAADIGARAIVVSNHGGRQFDAAPSSLQMLPSVCARVQGRCEVYVDGGVRSGTDVLKFLAAGASACLCGRAYLYGLSIAGSDGVRKALDILRRELQTAVQLVGITDLSPQSLQAILRVPDPDRRKEGR